MLGNYATSDLYLQYVGRRNQLASIINGVVFSSFYCKGLVANVDCSPWKTFASAISRQPVQDLYYTSLTMLNSGFDYDSGVSHNFTASCSDPGILSALVYAMNTGQSYNVLCNSVAGCKAMGRNFACYDNINSNLTPIMQVFVNLVKVVNLIKTCIKS